MNLKRHCDLCQHQKLSLKKGSICGVTNKKPNFNRTCVRIRFDKKLKNILEDIIIEFEELKQSKNKAYINFLFNLIFGAIIVVSGYFVWKYFIENYNLNSRAGSEFLALLVLFIGVGFYIIKNAINKLNKFKIKLINIKNDKIDVDETLRLYNKKYDYRIDFNKEIHGIKEVEIDIKFN